MNSVSGGRFRKLSAGTDVWTQLFDSWLYDEEKPFIHMKAIPTFEFLKEQIETGYFEELIREYILDNPHGSIVIIRPEQGMTARMDKELADRLQVYKKGLSAEEIEPW